MTLQTPSTPLTTPHQSAVLTPSGTTPFGQKAIGLATPTPGHMMSMTPEQLQACRWERGIDERNIYRFANHHYYFLQSKKLQFYLQEVVIAWIP